MDIEGGAHIEHHCENSGSFRQERRFGYGRIGPSERGRQKKGRRWEGRPGWFISPLQKKVTEKRDQEK